MMSLEDWMVQWVRMNGVGRVKDGNRRRGAAFLVLAFMLLVIVMSATQIMIRQEVSQRQSIRQSQRIAILESAIVFAESFKTNAANEGSIDDSTDVLFPVMLPIESPIADGQVTKRRVRVSLDQSSGQWVASWLIGDVEHETIRRKQAQ
jgi:type II secretory pathway component PulK